MAICARCGPSSGALPLGLTLFPALRVAAWLAAQSLRRPGPVRTRTRGASGGLAPGRLADDVAVRGIRISSSTSAAPPQRVIPAPDDARPCSLVGRARAQYVAG